MPPPGSKKRASLAGVQARFNKMRTRVGSTSGPRSGAFAGASDATFLQPLLSDTPSGRLSPPPKVFDPSPLLRKRTRSGSLSPRPKPVSKSDLSPSPLIPSSWPGLIRKSTLKLGKMKLMSSSRRLQRRLQGPPFVRRSESPRRQLGRSSRSSPDTGQFRHINAFSSFWYQQIPCCRYSPCSFGDGQRPSQALYSGDLDHFLFNHNWTTCCFRFCLNLVAGGC
jgi:hypothetical protein